MEETVTAIIERIHRLRSGDTMRSKRIARQVMSINWAAVSRGNTDAPSDWLRSLAPEVANVQKGGLLSPMQIEHLTNILDNLALAASAIDAAVIEGA